MTGLCPGIRTWRGGRQVAIARQRSLIACLRQGKRGRKPRPAGEDQRGQIPEMFNIHLQPPEVSDRVMPRHWEGALINGAGNKSAIGVLVERTTRLPLLAKMPGAMAESALAAITFKLDQINTPMRRTLTYDQGKEMAWHRDLARATKLRVHFCETHRPLGNVGLAREHQRTDCYGRYFRGVRTCTFTIRLHSIRLPACSMSAACSAGGVSKPWLRPTRVETQECAQCAGAARSPGDGAV